MKAIISLAILLMATLTAWADSAKDRWTIYPSYSNITEIEPVGNICFVLASGAVFSYNITDGDVQTYDKAGVMSDVEVSHIAWAKASKRLVVVYTRTSICCLPTATLSTCPTSTESRQHTAKLSTTSISTVHTPISLRHSAW